MAAWSAEIHVRRRGKAFTQAPIFVTVHAGTWFAAMGAAAREGHERLSSLYPRIQVEMVSLKLHRLAESTKQPEAE